MVEEKVEEVKELKGKLCHCSKRSYRTPLVEAAEAVCTCVEAVVIEGDDKDEEMAEGPALYNISIQSLTGSPDDDGSEA